MRLPRGSLVSLWGSPGQVSLIRQPDIVAPVQLTSRRQRVLVTGAAIVYALPVIRHLGRLGHTVTVADSHPRASGFYSRYTKSRWIYPRLDAGAEHFGESLAAYLAGHPQDRVVPLFEETIPVARAQERWPDRVHATLGGYRDLLAFHDKAAMYRTAAALGVPVPRTVELMGDAPSDFPYPAMLKIPQSSCGRGVLRVGGPADVARARDWLARDHALPAHVRPLLQEEIDAESLSVLAFAWRGRPKGLLVYRSIGLYPRRGGSGVIRESVRHAEVERHARTLLAGAAWHGPVGFDFLVERGGGRVFLIDANPRLTPGVKLAARCGFDAIAMMTADDEPADAGVVRAGESNVTEPMLVSWLGECLLAGPSAWREAWQLLGRLGRARPDVVDLGDWRSGRAALAALGDLVRSAGSPVPGGLELIRHAQFADYGAPS